MCNKKSNKICKYDGCTTTPTFNFEGEKTRLYCKTHKKDRMVDVKNPSCEDKECTTRPNYNFEGEKKALYCKTHKKDKMVKVKKHRTCEDKECTTRPYYNFEGEQKGLYCKTHKNDRMVDVEHERCKTYLCSTRVGERYDGYCLRCYINLFPDKPVSRNYKTKEFSVVDYVTSKYPHVSWVTDKTVSDGCSKRRPDLLLDLGYQVVIVEVDENQHVNYSCENKRIMLLSLDVNHRPIVFIRFNPDGYTNNNTRIKSCWSYNEKGICRVDKAHTTEWNARLKTLGSELEYWMDEEHKTYKTIESVQLFYNDI